MPRILAIDYGSKRSGVAVTDPMCIIASGLTTVLTTELLTFFEKIYFRRKCRKNCYWATQTYEQ